MPQVWFGHGTRQSRQLCLSLFKYSGAAQMVAPCGGGSPALAYPVPDDLRLSGGIVRHPSFHHVPLTLEARAGRCTHCGWVVVDTETLEITQPEPHPPEAPRRPWYRRWFGGAAPR